jgi:hypothetical protein
MVAEAMAAGAHGDDLRDAGDSILSVVASLWELRTATMGTPDTLTDAEREAVAGMASYFDTRGNFTLQAWGSLLRVLLKRMA